jgi:HEPN domain-containing protein
VRDVDIAADVFGRGVSQYRRQQHDPGFMDWLIARQGRVLYTTGRVSQREPAPSRVREEFESIALWRDRALADLREAQMSLASATPVPDAICFHSHAAIEKLLKAEIVALGVHPPRTHVLRNLLAQLPAGRVDSELRDDCGLLDALYPRSRYPELPMPDMEDARRAVGAALQARERIWRSRL